MTLRILLTVFGILFMGSLGAFFLFVSVLSIAAVVLILVGLMLMFGLGVQVGSRTMLPAASVEKAV